MEVGSSVLINEQQAKPKPLPCDPENPIVLVPLHHYPEFTFPCATLINMEWPRSRSSRLNSLWSCSHRFPVAMVLIKCEDRQVIGHCKLSLIPGYPEACFLESVVIHPDMRGKGLGTILMTKLEDYVCSRKLSTVYLSTMGQEKFYRKLGYKECEPVSLYAFSINIKSTNNCELTDFVKKPSDSSTNGELVNPAKKQDPVKKQGNPLNNGQLSTSCKEQSDQLNNGKVNKSCRIANEPSTKNQVNNSPQKLSDTSNKCQTNNAAKKATDVSANKGKLNNAGKKANHKAKSNRHGNQCNENRAKGSKNNRKNLNVLLLGCVTLSSPPPPPQPPPPPPKLLGESVMVKKTYMKKELNISDSKSKEEGKKSLSKSFKQNNSSCTELSVIT